MALPLLRLKTCGVGPSRRNVERPSMSWPVTTRRTDFVIVLVSLAAALQRAGFVDEVERPELLGDIGGIARIDQLVRRRSLVDHAFALEECLHVDDAGDIEFAVRIA